MGYFMIAVAAGAIWAGSAAAQDQDAANASNRAELVQMLDSNFKGVDINGDGNLSHAEMNAAAGRVAAKRVEQRFRSLDGNKDGMLSLAEFQGGASIGEAGAAIATAMLKLDANSDGQVSSAEFRSPLLEQFDRLDANKDGKLSDAEKPKPPAPEGR